MRLSRADKIHLEAAEGWIGLGDHTEANEELEQVSPRCRVHPDVLRLKYEVCAAGKHWELAAEIGRAICQARPNDPAGYLQLAGARDAMGRYDDAFRMLLLAIDRFPQESEI